MSKTKLNYGKYEKGGSTYAEGGEIKWKSISTITFSTKKEALKRLGLMKDSDDYRNLKVVKTTNGYDVSGEQKMARGGSTYAKGGEIYKATDVYQAPFNGKNYNMPYFIVNNEGYFLKEKYHRLNGNDFTPNTLFAISFLDKEDALSYMKKYNSELDKGGSTYAKGGSLEAHALAIGDEILGFNMGEAYVINKGVVYMVDLAKGKRKITKMTREDAISTFAKGGMTNNFDSDFMDLVKG